MNWRIYSILAIPLLAACNEAVTDDTRLDDEAPIACTEDFSVETVAANDAYARPMLAAGPSGAAQIVWLDEGQGALMRGKRGDEGWTIDTIDTIAGDDLFGNHNALVVDAAGAAHVVWFEAGLVLRYATDAGGDWEVSTIATGDLEGFYHTSVAIQIDPAGQPRIFWTEAPVALWSAVPGEDPEVLFEGEVNCYGIYPHGAAYDASGGLHLAFFGASFDTVYATITDTERSWTVLDEGIDIGTFSSVAIDGQGRPHVAYPRSGTNHLVRDPEWPAPAGTPALAFEGFLMQSEADGRVYLGGSDTDGLWLGSWDGTWETELLMEPDESRWFPTFAMDPVGTLHVAWYDGTSQELRYAQRCSDTD